MRKQGEGRKRRQQKGGGMPNPYPIPLDHSTLGQFLLSPSSWSLFTG